MYNGLIGNPFSRKGLTSHKNRLAVSRQPEKMYDLTGQATLDRRIAVGSAPFSGTSKNMNPRVPPPYVTPVPKHAQRIDWKSPTGSSVFKNPAFQKSYKRISQIVYGTPTTFARRGQLQTDWGSAHMKGYPIHQGRTQTWLPGLFPGTPSAADGTAMPIDHKHIVNHFDLGTRLRGHTVKQNMHQDFVDEGKRIRWWGLLVGFLVFNYF